MTAAECTVRPLAAEDLDAAGRLVRLAFGTFLHLPDPMATFGDRDMIGKRWSDTSKALGAYMGQRLVGLNVITKWGKFGWFGPLAVHPEFWGKGIAKILMTSTMDMFSDWETTAEGLFTFSESPKHTGLYGKFGFYPRFLTLVMRHEAVAGSEGYSTLSKLEDSQQEDILRQCREISATVYPGLDLSQEISSVEKRKLGDTVLLMDDSRVEGFAVCHTGAGTEAGSNNCYVKFAAVPSGDQSREKFSNLIEACMGFAVSSGAQTVEAGVNLGKTLTFEELKRLGFTTLFQGVAMQRPNEPGSNRPEVFAIEDWR